MPVLALLMLVAGCATTQNDGVRHAGEPHFDPQMSVDASGASQAPHRSSEHFDPQVSIDNFSFSPETLTVPAGTKVTWVNHDDVPHTATSNAKPRAFDSGALDTDQKFSYVFAAPGTYPYFCAVHPHMTGQIVVK
jgi:plastocyanin